MKCKTVQQTLSLGQAAPQGPVASWRVRQHLCTCSACRQVQAELEQLIARTAAWRNAAPDPALQARIYQALQDTTAPPIPMGEPVHHSVPWFITLKENSKMRRRLGFAGIVLLIAAGGLMTTSLPRASALTRLTAMKKAMQNVHTAHLSIWENTSLPNRQFCRREFWVQGDLLRQYIPGKLWLISSPDTNWYYIAETDRLEIQAHKQPPVKFDFSQILSDLKGFRKDGQGVVVEAEPDTVLRGRRVARIQVTELAPSAEALAAEQAQEEKAAQEQAEIRAQKGQADPVVQSRKTMALTLHSRRSLYWVDRATDLPLHSEQYEEEKGRWTLINRTDYVYDEPFPANLFDPQDLLRVGRQERKHL